MWVTTTDGDLVDIRGAWITRTADNGREPRIVAKFAVGVAEFGDSKFAVVILGKYVDGPELFRAWKGLAQAISDGESSHDMRSTLDTLPL